MMKIELLHTGEARRIEIFHTPGTGCFNFFGRVKLGIDNVHFTAWHQMLKATFNDLFGRLKVLERSSKNNDVERLRSLIFPELAMQKSYVRKYSFRLL